MGRFARSSGWIALSLLAVALVTAGEWYRGVTGLQQPPGRPELAGTAEGLRTLIWTDEGGVSDVVRLWILFDNHTGEEVKNLHFLSFETPGFWKVKDDGCWRGPEPVCRPGSKAGIVEKTGLPPSLADRHSAVIFATVRPKFSFGRHGATGILVWQNANGQDFQRAVILPGVEVHSDLLDWASGFVKAVEICALPLMLAFLGWKLRQRDDQRKAEQDTAREASERLQAEKQEWQIRLKETWNLELPKVIENVTTYYMPAAGAIQDLLENKDLNAESSEQDLYHCLYRLLRLIRRMAHLSENIGGIYLKDLEGEMLAGECWNLFELADRRQLQGLEEDKARALDAISPQVSLAQFMDLVNEFSSEGSLSSSQKRRVAGSLASLACRLRTWVNGEFKEDLVPLELFLLILSFEMNRPLEFWYGHLPDFPEGFGDIVKKLPETQENLRQKLLEYEKNCKAAVERSKASWEGGANAKG